MFKRHVISAIKENSSCQETKAYKKKAFNKEAVFLTLHEFHWVSKAALMTELLHTDMCGEVSTTQGAL